MVQQETRGRKPTKPKNPEVAKYAKRFKEIRRNLGYTSAEIFCYDFRLSRVQYARMESGDSFNIRTFERYLKATGIKHKDFFSKGFD